ncbi:hypothetical protein [Halobacteriovorax sp. JY17]|uniref:hypothetical protein n=1 Tax=Halobacteriovorax sp. JY17 TaxID=2014617 RepID=UPI000C4DD97A|nr:hypothetical protein [Halobacteriovorax sp. JY17]PIK15250.1 MAG: hypothetical protein CES88_00645 [Halobacteriovorax sp. JY17]
MKDNKDFETLKKEQEEKARMELEESGLDHLITFTLENFAYRYLETAHSKNIVSEFNGANQYTVTSFETDPMLALKVSDLNAKKGAISLAKRFSATKGVGLKIRYQLLCDTSGVSGSGPGLMKCRASINWNMDRGFASEAEFESYKEESIEFSDPLVLRNKLSLLLENVCQIF